jgi:two-component system, NarL family, nitrate/nitrite response regulator NarL
MSGDLRPRVALVVQIGLYREALARALPGCGLDVVGCASPGPETAAMARGVDPDVILVDVTRSAGIATLRELTEAVPETRLLAIAVRDLDPDVLACIEAGAMGYVLRDSSLDDLADAVRRAVRDEPLASPHVIATLMRRVADLAANGDPASVGDLTTRELEVVELIEKGLSNKEIAAQLSIAVTTVKNHVHSILEKLKVHRRGEAASLVRGSGSAGPTTT